MKQHLFNYINSNFIPPITLSFLIKWVLGNMLASGLGIIVGLLAATNILTAPNNLIFWAVVGMLVGVIQQRVLPVEVDSSHWIAASMAGWTISGALVGRAGVDWAIMGGIVGGMQYFVLKRHIYQAGWWILANATGLVFGASIGWSIRFSSRWVIFRSIKTINPYIIEAIDWVLAGVVGGIINALIIGICLIWLVSWRQKNEDE